MASSCDVSMGNCPKFTLPNPGDTGTGKTSVVQHVGRLLGREAPINQATNVAMRQAQMEPSSKLQRF